MANRRLPFYAALRRSVRARPVARQPRSVAGARGAAAAHDRMKRMLVRYVFVTIAALGVTNAQTQEVSRKPVPLSRIVDYEPAWSPDGKSIAFVSNRGGSMKIYVISADGGGVKQLTFGTDEDDAPAWSPNGSRIAYVRVIDGNPEIHVMNADGSNAVRLTNDAGIDIHPHWSSDGARILWNSSRNSRNRTEPETIELFTMRADGSDIQQITHGGISTYASWSPDNSRILFRKQLKDGNSEVFVMNADGSAPENLTHDPAFDGWPAWSRDGRRIVFAREHGDGASIRIMNRDGTGAAVLVDLPGRHTNPRWSPADERIVFSRQAYRQVRLYILEVAAK
jgi:Tol biopolymer transport system component